MPREAEICLSAASGKVAAPTLDKSQFLIDNPHCSNGFVRQGTPYVVQNGAFDSKNPEHWAKRHPELIPIFQQLNMLPQQEQQKIADMNGALGPDMLLALSEFYDKEVVPWTKTNAHSVAGAAFGALEAREVSFGKQIEKYQRALIELRKAAKSKAPAAQIRQLEWQARDIHERLNTRFRAELQKFFTKNQSRRGNIWSNAQRGINIAKSARTDQPLHLKSTHEVNLINRFAKGANMLGKGVLILDAGVRANGVHSTYQAGRNWQRQMVQEITGFGFSAAAGMWLGGAATAAATLLLGATPFGWVIIIVFGLAVGFTSAYFSNLGAKYVSGALYDYSASF